LREAPALARVTDFGTDRKTDQLPVRHLPARIRGLSHGDACTVHHSKVGRQCRVLRHRRCAIVIAGRFRCGACQSECAVDRIANGYNKALLCGVVQPWLDRCGKAASEGQTINPKGDEPVSERIDVPTGSSWKTPPALSHGAPGSMTSSQGQAGCVGRARGARAQIGLGTPRRQAARGLVPRPDPAQVRPARIGGRPRRRPRQPVPPTKEQREHRK
jgi:hypothetical protein